jgi:hypothetical protein
MFQVHLKWDQISPIQFRKPHQLNRARDIFWREKSILHPWTWLKVHLPTFNSNLVQLSPLIYKNRSECTLLSFQLVLTRILIAMSAIFFVCQLYVRISYMHMKIISFRVPRKKQSAPPGRRRATAVVRSGSRQPAAGRPTAPSLDVLFPGRRPQSSAARSLPPSAVSRPPPLPRPLGLGSFTIDAKNLIPIGECLSTNQHFHVWMCSQSTWHNLSLSFRSLSVLMPRSVSLGEVIC